MWKAVIVGVLSMLALSADDCPVDRETKCVDDFKDAFPYCKKAAEAAGKDFDADINCVKYFATMEQDCWPCICYMAHKESLKIRGC